MVPPGNVHKRWTAAARDGTHEYPSIGAGVHRVVGDAAGRKNMLYLAAMELMSTGAVSEPAFQASMRALGEARHALRVMADARPALVVSLLGNDVDHESAPEQVHHEPTLEEVHDEPALEEVQLRVPLKVKARGRPATSRLKSRADYYGAKRRKTRGVADCYSGAESDVPVVLVEGTCKKREARCGLCKKEGHNRQTCQRRRAGP